RRHPSKMVVRLYPFVAAIFFILSTPITLICYKDTRVKQEVLPPGRKIFGDIPAGVKRRWNRQPSRESFLYRARTNNWIYLLQHMSTTCTLHKNTMGLFDFLREKNSHSPVLKSGGPSLVSPDRSAIAAQLESMSYFKYADPADLEQLKSDIGKGLAEDHYLPFIDGEHFRNGDRLSYKPKDPRHYILDGEMLFEQGGIIAALQEIQPLWEQMNVRMEASTKPAYQ
ncbi:MAG TPA: hypothetical protein VGC22_06295, partial [Chitinophaga sp.]